jgi:ferric-dicitrate binding protein FerR (iron transport regulator)
MDTRPLDIQPEMIQAAALWYFQFDDGCSGGKAPAPERWEEFQAWLKADPMHQTAYKQVQNACDYLVHFGVRAGRRRPPREPS